jgi:hypothetical protein
MTIMRDSFVYSGTSPGKSVSCRGIVETAMIVAVLAGLFFLLPHEVSNDDGTRLHDIRELISYGRLTSDPYSLLMPLASVPVIMLMLSHLTDPGRSGPPASMSCSRPRASWRRTGCCAGARTRTSSG